MEKGLEILWTDLALEELAQIVEYLEQEFTEKEIGSLGNEIERILSIITYNPTIFPFSDKYKIRKVVIMKFNTLYYRIIDDRVEIISFFSNRQNPDNRNV
ncbi:plasmid stabilization system protein ParE [Epilithonimonas hungarica]|uniref:type II toxin-antitoxin system RelE/ParE family toxin n=1 Tax=Epilithonimonas hungarica TaxID=454006 RepID=UPI00278686BE|nr:type II toxin-antitoxin system RelE/ParE family toxin [Epilithonimonas hungarica]MDP9957243.1 plasmid stabilization system protein ParE [Epilithonimonas hungarica]